MNKIENGGKRRLIQELPPETKNIVVDIIRLSNRAIAGFDLVYDYE